MKLTTPEISWHNRDPIYSLDFQYKGGHVTRLVTSGTDKNIRIWSVGEGDDGKTCVNFLSNLDRHSRAVNVVRFSPDGNTLASAGDDCVVMLWKLQAVCQNDGDIFEDDESDVNNKETWTVQKILRGHLEDIYDLCWSPDGEKMITGSVDNSAIVWDVGKGKAAAYLKESTSFIQGVAWDPKNQLMATLSCDRRCRIYSVATQQCLHTVHKMALPCQPSDQQKPKFFKMFHDDTMKSFFRRLSFSPDGEILATPAGLVELADKEKVDDVIQNDDVIVKDSVKDAKAEVNATFLFSRRKLTKPAVYLPSPAKTTVAVRFCPVLFQLREVPRDRVPDDADPGNLKPWDKYQTLFCLPYRVVFAVLTEDCVLVYDSQQTLPLACISKIHYHQLSDLAWSADGRVLVVSSTDGYCSIVTFDLNELGDVYIPSSVEKAVNDQVPEKSATLLVNVCSPDEAPRSAAIAKTTEDTMDLHLELDGSGDEMDTTPSADSDQTKNNMADSDATPSVAVRTTIEAPPSELNATNAQPTKLERGRPRRIAFTTLTKKT